jgi:hypothetical protein
MAVTRRFYHARERNQLLAAFYGPHPFADALPRGLFGDLTVDSADAAAPAPHQVSI